MGRDKRRGIGCKQGRKLRGIENREEGEEEEEGKWVNVLRDAALLSFRKWHYGNLLPLPWEGNKILAVRGTGNR